jgi:hypothetical protein
MIPAGLFPFQSMSRLDEALSCGLVTFHFEAGLDEHVGKGPLREHEPGGRLQNVT